MKTFIAWSGARSRLLANALVHWIPDVIQRAKTWTSDNDIEAGAQWISNLTRGLDDTRFGILCITPENLNSRWIMFEAGSMSKGVGDARVVPYLFQVQVSDIEFPLAQFQGVTADEAGTYKLLKSLNGALKPALTEERLRRSFERSWPDLQQEIDKIPSEVPHLPRPNAIGRESAGHTK